MWLFRNWHVMDLASKPERAPDPAEVIPSGTRRMIAGQERVFYDGYWIKTYPVPDDTLFAKKRLIEALTRRLFNHTEHGLNIPGTRLEEARRHYEAEADHGRRRVKGAMLAGALFNRATDIFTKLVELQAEGVEIRSDDALMRECGQCLMDAMDSAGWCSTAVARRASTSCGVSPSALSRSRSRISTKAATSRLAR